VLHLLSFSKIWGDKMIETSFYSANQINHYHPEVVAYYYKEWQDFQMAFHSHEAIEIMYVISGDCHVELESDVIPLKKRQFIMIDSNIQHRLIIEDGKPCRMLNVEFVLENKCGVFPSIKDLSQESENLQALLSDKQAFIVLKDVEGLYHTLKSLVLELGEKDHANSTIIIQTLISQLLLKIARIAVQSKERKVLSTDLYVRKVINYIHHNYDCDLKVAELASIVYLHPSYLHRIFKESMNCTLMEYITEIRIDKAKMLLAKTDIPITEISDYVGINSRQYFSFLFKRLTDETPRNYRKKAQKIQ
jgi:AraC-like DNA-binding protein